MKLNKGKKAGTPAISENTDKYSLSHGFLYRERDFFCLKLSFLKVCNNCE